MSSDKELEEQLIEVGTKLVDPPSAIDDLLLLLDQIESCLLKVEQCPSKCLQNALSPAVEVLVSGKLMNHSNADVKVAVASCISEITRITAPDAPYNDDQMTEIFQLIVSSFENLSDKSSRSYTKRTSILETVAKVRSCVVMLDLECDALILEMFQHFLKSIRDYHPENVFTSMETIMTLVLEESEDISPELLKLLLFSVKRDNEEVTPITRKLGERVIESCAAELKPGLMLAVKSIGISLDEYSKVVVSICQETSGSVDHNDVRAASKQMADDSNLLKTSSHDAQEDRNMETEEPSSEQVDSIVDKSPKLILGNGVTGEADTLLDVNVLEKQDVGSVQHTDQSGNNTSGDVEPQSLDTKKVASTECMPELSAIKRGRKPKAVKVTDPTDIVGKEASEKLPDNHESDKDLPSIAPPTSGVDMPSENENADTYLSLPKALDNESVKSPTMSLHDEKRLRKPGRPKKKQTITKEARSTANDAAKKVNEDANDPEEKSKRRSGKKAASGEDKIPIKEVASPADGAEKKTNDEKTNLDIKTNKRSGKNGSSGSSSEDKSPTTVDAPTSDLEAKSLNQSAKKMDVSSGDSEESQLKQTVDKKRKGWRKACLIKNVKSSLTKDDGKEIVSSPKYAPKWSKVDQLLEETPKINNKRKFARALEKTSDAKDFGENLVGSKIKVWWPKDKMFYEGVVDSFDSVKKKHKVLYVDGDEEILNLKRQKWDVVEDDTKTDEVETADGLTDGSPEMSQKKKAKVRADPSTKKAVTDASPKMGGIASSSKSKSSTIKSGRKSRVVSKSDGKSKDAVLKTAYRSDEGSEKGEDEITLKGGNKSVDTASEVSRKSEADENKMSKLKNVDNSSPKSAQPKQGIVKTHTKSKGLTSKALNGTKKLKSSSSKANESGEVEADSTDSTMARESVKVSEGKNGKKRQRGSKS